MSDDDIELEDGELIMGRVAIYRVYDYQGVPRDEVRTDDGHGEQLDMATAVGMLAIAQHTLLCECADIGDS